MAVITGLSPDGAASLDGGGSSAIETQILIDP